MRSSEHLDLDTLYELLDGRLDTAAEQRVEAHLWRCGTCRALREECGALLSAVRWYGADPPRPPSGYWESFWGHWSGTSVVPLRTARARNGALVSGVLALAASLALLIGIVGDAGKQVPDGVTAQISTPAPTQAEWAEDYEFFERATIAVGSIDPMSKGVVLASFAEAP